MTSQEPDSWLQWGPKTTFFKISFFVCSSE